MRSAIHLGASISALTAAVSVNAQEAPNAVVAASDAEAAETDPNAIVVTARRVEERLQDVPAAIIAFSQDTLTERGITTSYDLAR